MKFIVGLGNPGPEYKATKHNIGFEVVGALAKANGIKLNKKFHFSIAGTGKIADNEVTLVLPHTYMNLSGNAVGELFRGDLSAVKDLIVVCDDINMELGRIRIRKQGSSGGHKGMESIIRTIGTNDFIRVRIGIATEVHKGDITNYVLSPFKRHEMRNVTHSIAMAEEAIEAMLEDDIDTAMNKFNKRKAGTS